MSRTATTLLVGFAVGALTVVLMRRYRETTRADEPEAILERMSEQLKELEQRIDSANA